MEDKNINELLNKRIFVHESSDFADRIISASHTKTQKRKTAFNINNWLENILSDFLPRPALMLTSMLTIGFVAGFFMPINGSADSDLQNEFIQEYVYDDGGTL